MSRTARRRCRCSRRSAPSRPQFAHEALLVAAEGKLSKRLGSYGAEHLREEGVEPMALLSVLARIGTSQPVEPTASASTSSRRASTSRIFGRAPAHFDPHEVELINARLLHKLDYAAVADRLPAAASEEDWLLLRPNLERLADFADWFEVLARRDRAARARPRGTAAGQGRRRHRRAARLVAGRRGAR